jgi:hypothetical protein
MQKTMETAMKMIMLKARRRDNLWNLKRVISEPPEVTALTASPTHAPR